MIRKIIGYTIASSILWGPLIFVGVEYGYWTPLGMLGGVLVVGGIFALGLWIANGE